MRNRPKNRHERRRQEAIQRKNPQTGLGKPVKGSTGNKDSLNFSLPTNDLGPPGISSELHLVAVEMGKDDGYDKLTDDSPREFEVNAMLCKEKDPGRAWNFDIRTTTGSSFIFHPGGHWVPILETTLGQVICIANARNEIGGFKFTCVATSRNEAVAQFNRAIAPALDHMSYISDVPIQVEKTLCLDKKHGTSSLGYTAPYHMVNLPSEAQSPSPMLLPVYALYREAKNSNSDYYRFLCYFKIMEGIYTSIRPQVRKLAREIGVSLPKHDETVPDLKEIAMWKPDYIGKPIKSLFDEVFSGDFRNAIAHFSLDDSQPLLISDNITSAKFANEIYPIERCCRILIKSEEVNLQVIETYKHRQDQDLIKEGKHDTNDK